MGTLLLRLTLRELFTWRFVQVSEPLQLIDEPSAAHITT
jgi:hypothetical protein